MGYKKKIKKLRNKQNENVVENKLIGENDSYNLKRKNDEHPLLEGLVQVQTYFQLHNKVSEFIENITNIIVERSEIEKYKLNEESMNEIVIKEMNYKLIELYELFRHTLQKIEVCLERMKTIREAVIKENNENYKYMNLNRFYQNMFYYFTCDYKLKKNICDTVIYIDGTSEDELNKIQTLGKESPYLYIIFHKFQVNKWINDCKNILNHGK